MNSNWQELQLAYTLNRNIPQISFINFYHLESPPPPPPPHIKQPDFYLILVEYAIAFDANIQTCKILMPEDFSSHMTKESKFQGISCFLERGKAKSAENRSEIRPVVQ